MAIILNIETSGPVCSVAISVDGVVEYELTEERPMKHAEMLAPFVEKCMGEITRRELRLDAVAVSIGPGSYTGLRIGLSLAKGLAFGLGIPLLAIDTLQILAVTAMFSNHPWTGEEILIPMIDARRMEVYTAAYRFDLSEAMEPQPLIAEADSYANIPADTPVVFIGEAAAKTQPVIQTHPDALWLTGIRLHARHMMPLAEKALREKTFADVAYVTPKYLKEYQTTVPKRKIF